MSNEGSQTNQPQDSGLSGCLLIVGFVLVVYVVCWFGGELGSQRRAKMTPSQRAAEDRELDYQETYRNDDDQY